MATSACHPAFDCPPWVFKSNIHRPVKYRSAGWLVHVLHLLSVVQSCLTLNLSHNVNLVFKKIPNVGQCYSLLLFINVVNIVQSRSEAQNFRPKFPIFSKIFQTRPNASEPIQMHPSAPKRIRIGPGRSEQVRNLQKTCTNFAKLAKIPRNLAKIISAHTDFLNQFLTARLRVEESII